MVRLIIDELPVMSMFGRRFALKTPKLSKWRFVPLGLA